MTLKQGIGWALLLTIVVSLVCLLFICLGYFGGFIALAMLGVVWILVILLVIAIELIQGY